MRGHEAIIAIRKRGLKPAKWVWVDVGTNTAWQAFLLKTSGVELSPHMPASTYVCLAPGESTRLADWGWTVGLKIMVEGDDEARVMAAAEGIKAARASRVVALLNGGMMEIGA